GPDLPVPVSRPDIHTGELSLEVLKLGTLFHGFHVEQLKILDIDDSRLSIQQKKPVISIGAQRICNPCKRYRTLILEPRHDPKLAMIFLVEFPRKPHGVGRGAGLTHLADHAFRCRRKELIAGSMGRGDELRWYLPDGRRFKLCDWVLGLCGQAHSQGKKKNKNQQLIDVTQFFLLKIRQKPHLKPNCSRTDVCRFSGRGSWSPASTAAGQAYSTTL